MHNTHSWALEGICQNGSGFDVPCVSACMYKRCTGYLCKLCSGFLLQEERFLIHYYLLRTRLSFWYMDKTKFWVLNLCLSLLFCGVGGSVGVSPGNVVRGTWDESICNKTSSADNDKISVFHGKLVCHTGLL